jgi:hypothetical protein
MINPYEKSEKAHDRIIERLLRDGIPKEELIDFYKEMGFIDENGQWKPEHEDIRPYLKYAMEYDGSDLG